ncbi:hypothetical protein VNO77_03763 [Canavalia gladiata]|uniref:Uncharacterized protein n=1 Tax=Canavalia gladiata TaxID=3824 RepID=A0AAN9N0Y9_CANGL
MAHVGLLLMIGSLGLVFMAHLIGVTGASVPSLVLVVQRSLPTLDKSCPCSTSPVLHDVKHMTTCLCSTESLYTTYDSWNAPNITALCIPIVPPCLGLFTHSTSNKIRVELRSAPLSKVSNLNSIDLYSSAYNPLPPFEQDYYNLSITNASPPTLSQAHVQRPFGFALLEFANKLQPVTMARLEPKFLMRNLRGQLGRRTLVNLALKHSLQASILLLLYQWCSKPESCRSYSHEPEGSSASFTVCASKDRLFLL